MIIDISSMERKINDWEPTNELERDPAAFFRSLYKQEKDAKLAQRYLCMALLFELTPVDKVAAILGIHPDTVMNWIDRYDKAGIEGIALGKSTGRPPIFPVEERGHLKEEIMKSPRDLGYGFNNWDGRALQHHIKEVYGEELGLSTVYNLLGDLGFRLVMPRPGLANADEKKA